jgi:ketosteroid isomerase-like protein
MTVNDPQDADTRWLTALLARDVETAAGFVHDDYALTLVYPRRSVVRRVEWLETLPDYVIARWDVQQSMWDVEGDVASHLHLVDMTATVFGTPRNGLFVLTDTWLRTDQGWRVWRRHSTPLAAGAYPHDSQTTT